LRHVFLAVANSWSRSCTLLCSGISFIPDIMDISLWLKILKVGGHTGRTLFPWKRKVDQISILAPDFITNEKCSYGNYVSMSVRVYHYTQVKYASKNCCVPNAKGKICDPLIHIGCIFLTKLNTEEQINANAASNAEK
jgi:hypothetical protein